MKNVVEYDAWQKLQLAPLTEFNPQVLAGMKYSQHSGYLLELERLYSTMYLEWSTLKKDANEVTEAVAGLTWTVVPYVRDGEEPDDTAKEVARVVSDALWKVAPQRPGEFSHCFTELLGSMVHALYRSVNVHEVVWAFTPELVYPLEFKQLGAQYYMWETRQGEPDRLMLVPDGMNYAEPVAFEPGRFVVALNTTGPDHPMYNADFYSLVGYFVAAKFGLPGLQGYVKRYGHPLRKFTIEDGRKRKELEAKLRSMPDVYDVFLGPGESLDVTAIPAGANVPHEVLLRVAENACHQLLKGNTLTSDVGDKGGSRAQAEVHMGVEASLVRRRGEFVARVLNRQLIPYIVKLNYGRMDLPMPELRCQVPEQKANIQKAEYWGAVMAIPGMKVRRSDVYDDLGLAQPNENDEVLEVPGHGHGMPAAPSADAAPDGLPDGFEGLLGGDGEPEVSMAGKRREPGVAELRRRAERMLPVAMRRWAKPTIERFERMLREGVSPTEVLERLHELQPDTQALADAMSAVTAAGLGVLGAEDAEAANPYGCNQYGEGWAHPHEGNSTERVGKSKLLTHKDGDGNVRQIDTDKRYPGKGAYKGVGKDGEEPKKEPKKEPKPEPKKKPEPKPEPKPEEKLEPKGGRKRYFEPAKTRAEAKRNTASLLSGELKGNTKYVTWGNNVPLEVQNEYNETMAEMMDKYPLAVPVVKLGSYTDGNDGVGARCVTEGGMFDPRVRLQVNQDHKYGGLHYFPEWKPYKEKKMGYTRHNVGATDSGIDVRSVMIHEYGHALHAKTSRLARYSFFDPDGTRDAVDAQNTVLEAYNKALDSGDMKKISWYARSKPSEFFAECFAARELNEELPDYIHNMLDKVIKVGTVRV